MAGDSHGTPGEGDSDKTDQQRFDEEIARDSRKAVPFLIGLGVVAALVMSTIALINSGGSTKTVTVQSAQSGGQGQGGPRPLTGDALGKQLFVSGDPSVGATSCGSCHTMKAAGATGTIGPNLDKELTADPPAPTRESIVDPNKEIAKGYKANVMPLSYDTRLSPKQIDALTTYIYRSTNSKAKAK